MSFYRQSVKTAIQAFVDNEFHNSPKKKPAMNKEERFVQKAVESAVSVLKDVFVTFPLANSFIKTKISRVIIYK